jgi:hypothetical protein
MNNSHQDAPDTREVFCWLGKDPHTDLIRLTDAVAAKTRAELFRVEGNLCRLNEEKRFVVVDKRTMRAIIAKHIRTFRWVSRGDDQWEIEFISFGFLPDANLRHEPNEQSLLGLMTALVPKVASGPTRPNNFSNHEMREILLRLKQGDTEKLIAHRFGCETDVIREIDRAARGA